jgi:gluconolactonase
MNTRFLQFIWISLVLVSAMARAEEKPATIEGIGPVGEVVKLQGDFMFTEGPASDGQGHVYFSDVAGDTIYRLDTTGKATAFLTPSKHANGLMFNSAGTLFACQMDGQIVAISPAAKSVKVLTDKFEGQRYNAPNDLVLDRAGGMYFTDPRFRAPMPLPQGKEGVYYRAADGTVTRLLDDLPAPNGVSLSPDEKTLYVIPSLQKEMIAYTVESPGKLAERRVFCSLQQPAGTTGPGGGGDGLSIDVQGNLYITSRLGIQVFSAAGKLLGILEFPEQPANCAFGGKENRTLYVTARTSLYAVELKVPGHVFPGK